MKSQPKILDTFQIIGFIVSTAISIGLIFFKQDTILSVMFGLILASFTQLFDLQLRQSESEQRLLQANILSQKLYRDEWLFKHIQQIVENYQIIGEGWYKFFKVRSNDAIIECRNLLHSMAEGYMVAQPRDSIDFGTEACKVAQKYIKATDTGDLAYWRSSHGQRFLQANIEAIQRGVKVIRIFIKTSNELQKNIDIFQEQQRAGIEVYIVQPQELPQELIKDYLIVDDSVLSVMTFTVDGQPHEERISIDEVEAQRFVKKFDVLRQQSKTLEQLIKPR